MVNEWCTVRKTSCIPRVKFTPSYPTTRPFRMSDDLVCYVSISLFMRSIKSDTVDDTSFIYTTTLSFIYSSGQNLLTSRSKEIFHCHSGLDSLWLGP